MKIKNIKHKIKELGITEEEIILGDFDVIGEYTAKKNRDPNSTLYKTSGCFFRPNYERGILIYSLIKKYNIESFLEVGFGRGYSTFSACYAFDKLGIKGKIKTVDVNFNKKYIQSLFDNNIFPREWLERIEFVEGDSKKILPKVSQKYDLVLIDGDHSKEGVEIDWSNLKEKFNKVLIFDDYHIPPKEDEGIQVTKVVDNIKDYHKEAIIMDRQIFTEDRKNYEVLDAQVIITHE